MLSLDLGDGLTLTSLEPWQAAEFAAFVAAERDHLAPWLPWGSSIEDEEKARAFLQRYADRTAADGPRICACVSTAAWSAGPCSGSSSRPAASARSASGWPRRPGPRRRHPGDRRDARLGRRRRGIHRVEWHCAPENTASRRVAQRLGMTLEGTLRESVGPRGKMWDTEVWAVLAPEWRARTT